MIIRHQSKSNFVGSFQQTNFVVRSEQVVVTAILGAIGLLYRMNGTRMIFTIEGDRLLYRIKT